MKKNVEKKKRIGKILVPALISFVIFSGMGFYIPGEETDFISIQEQEAADAEEELSTDEIVKQFYEWYGYLPDENDGGEVYNFLANTLHSDYSKDDYEDEYADSEDDDDYYIGNASFLSSGLAKLDDSSKNKPVTNDNKKDNKNADSKPKVDVKTTVEGNKKTIVTTTTEVKKEKDGTVETKVVIETKVITDRLRSTETRTTTETRITREKKGSSQTSVSTQSTVTTEAKEEVREDVTKKEDTKKDIKKKDYDNKKKEDTKKKDDVKKDDPKKKDDVKKDDNKKKDDVKKDDTKKKDDIKKDDTKEKDDVKKDDNKKEDEKIIIGKKKDFDIKKKMDDAKKEEEKKKEDVKKDDTKKKDDIKKEDRKKKEDVKKDDTKKNDDAKKNDVSPSDEKREKFINCAEKYLGTPYVFGGTSRSGIDCSGLVYLAAQDAGLGTLPRTARTMFNITSRVDKSAGKRGDLVFFVSGGSITHVAIYLGDDTIMHAVSAGSRTGVITTKLFGDNYWSKYFYAMGRIIPD